MLAFQKRDIERERLFEQIKRSIYKIEDDLDSTQIHVVTSLSLAFISQIVLRTTSLSNRPTIKIEFSESELWKNKFMELVYVPIDNFARTPCERDFLLSKMAEWLLAQITQPINSKLIQQQNMHPEKVYGAKAMDEVLFDDDASIDHASFMEVEE